MKIQYAFVTGEILELEVAEELGAQIMAIEKIDRNKERSETRRHQSLDAMDFEGALFSDKSDIQADFIHELEVNALYRAMEQLLPQQRELIQRVFFDGCSYADISREENVDRSAVRKRMERIIEKMKVFEIDRPHLPFSWLYSEG